MQDDNTPHKSSTALLLVDVINHFEFPEGDKLLRQALPVAPKIARLKQRAREARIPVIYVNDNFGQWRSDAAKVLDYCLRTDAPSRVFVEQLRPDDEDYFVLKPMHSAFYETPLELLLRHLGVSTLILSGIATNSCIQYTAHDAKMRNYRILVPADCSASRSRREHVQAIEHMEAMASATVTPSTSLRLKELTRRHGKGSAGPSG